MATGEHQSRFEITSTATAPAGIRFEDPDLAINVLNADITLHPDAAGDIVYGGINSTTVETRAAADTELTITSGSHAVQGKDLIIAGGAGPTSATHGDIQLGQDASDQSVLKAAPANDMRLKVELNKDVLIGSDAGTGAIIGPDEGNLSISGGESFGPSTANGGDLHLSGGTSALGTDGIIYFDSPVVFASVTPNSESFCESLPAPVLKPG